VCGDEQKIDQRIFSDLADPGGVPDTIDTAVNQVIPGTFHERGDPKPDVTQVSYETLVEIAHGGIRDTA
jgi:hypothetical protein